MQLTNFVLEKMQIAFLPLPALLCLFSLGVLLVAKGGDLFVESAAKLAKLFKIPEATIGATLVSFATALPEILVSLFAAREGKIDMAVENAVGSVNANIGLIFALALAFFGPKANLRAFDRKAVLLLVCASFLFFTAKDGQISKPDAFFLFLLFLLCCLESVSMPKKNQTKNMPRERQKAPMKKAFLPFFTFWIGALLLSVGADLLVDNGTTLARRFGISEAILAATILSVGTALPEWVTAVCAIRKGETELSIGNIFGANCIDLTLILSLCTWQSGNNLPIAKASFFWSLPLCILLSFFSFLAVKIPKISKKQMAVCLSFCYLFSLFLRILLPRFYILPF